MKFYFYSLYLLSFLILPLSYAKADKHKGLTHIIFDMDGVLIEQNKMLFALNLLKNAPAKVLAYAAAEYTLHGKGSLEKKMFETFITHTGSQPGQTHEKALDNKSQELPLLLCQWQDGTYSSEDVKRIIWEEICTKKDSLWHKTLWEISKIIFDPILFSLCMEPNFKLWNEIKEIQAEGSYKIYILSNYPADTFEALYQRFFELFHLFPREHIYISAYHGHLKPKIACFNDFLKTYDIEPHTALFLDDQITNITGAAAAKINSAVYNKKIHLPSFLKNYSPLFTS